jgi:imidazolonepropionase-like amidohydrolase
MARAALVLFSLVLLGASPPAAFDLAIRHARIVHGDGRVTPAATILIAAGRIARVDAMPAADGVPVRREIEAAGRTVVPGLIDAHVHLEPWMLPLFLKFGVTTVRDIHNAPDYVFALGRDDSPTYPRVVAAGALLDGPGTFWTKALIVDDLTSVRSAVRRQVDAGADLIAIETRLKPSLVAIIVQEANARGVPVAGHLGVTTATEAATLGIASIEQLSGIAESASANPDRLIKAHDEFFGGWTASELEWSVLPPGSLERVARSLIERSVTIVPTLALHEAYSSLDDPGLATSRSLMEMPMEARWTAEDAGRLMARARWTADTLSKFKATLPLLQRFVRGYWQLGGRIASGTDAGRQFVAPGASLHRELELYVGAGLTPAAALRTATVDAAALLGIANQTGTVEVGKDADLLLVDGDPLVDIRVLRRITAVVRKGVVILR